MLDLFLALKKWGETSRGWKSNFIMAVDGSEIRLSPVEIGSLSHYLHGFLYVQPVVGNGISEPSTVAFPSRSSTENG